MSEPEAQTAQEVPSAKEAGGAAPRKSAAGTVAAGILSSRVLGLVRESVVQYFFGLSALSDVYQAAFKAPNLLQNLLGEGTLSAAFIPIYSRMLEEGREEEAGRFAGAVFGLLVATVAVLVLAGIVLAAPLVSVMTPGWINDAQKVAAGTLSVNRFDLAVQAVRIMFPTTGALVLAAWALGVLNSHRRFFLPYFAPVLQNIAIIGGLFFAAYVLLDDPFHLGDDLPTDALVQLLFAAFWGALLGGLLQFLVQLPLVARLMKGFRFSFSTKVKGVREALRSLGPVLAGRGVYQFSSYLDAFLASWLAAGALAALRPALILYMLPVSLFGLSVAASELPELSRIRQQDLGPFLNRVERSLRQTLFLTIPTFVGYLFFGFLIIGALFRHGNFGLNDNWLVYFVLGGYSLGLLATTISRLLQNSFYALNDTKTPAKIAVVRVVVSGLCAVPFMFLFDQYQVSRVVGLPTPEQTLFLGVVGIALGTTVGAWVELWLLERSLAGRLGTFSLPWSRAAKMVGLSVLAAVPAGAVWWLLAGLPKELLVLIVVGLYGALYLAVAHFTGAPEVEAWAGRFFQRFR